MPSSPPEDTSATAHSTPDRHILSVLVENHHGVLSRVSGMFSSRGFNIDSLTVCETEDPTMSRMTLSVLGRRVVVEQIRKQLEKLAEVISIDDLTEQGDFLERELALIKLRPHSPFEGAHIERLSADFGARRVDATERTATYEIVGHAEYISQYIQVAGKSADIVE
ncbi:MAG: acetolactate synthase small subunit, partial [Myxococcota bacterium]